MYFLWGEIDIERRSEDVLDRTRHKFRVYAKTGVLRVSERRALFIDSFLPLGIATHGEPLSSRVSCTRREQTLTGTLTSAFQTSAFVLLDSQKAP